MAQQGMNLASKYAKKVDERFATRSQAALALNHDYEFDGVHAVNIYSIPTVPMNNYTRSGTNRYGTPTDLQNNVQTVLMNRDRSFTFAIDRGDKIQSQYVMDAARALARQIKEVVIPEYDTYAFHKLCKAAWDHGAKASTSPDKTNAYKLFLNAQESLSDHYVPEAGRVCFCTYAYANLLKQDAAFMPASERTKKQLDQGVIGEVDGCRVVKVPKSKLPAGTDFLLAHRSAACGPRQLTDYRTHANPVGISGWVVEGRLIYDVFVLDQKIDALYFHGSTDPGTYSEPASSVYGRGGFTALATAPSNPASAGAFEYDATNGVYVPSAATSPVTGTTYYVHVG